MKKVKLFSTKLVFIALGFLYVFGSQKTCAQSNDSLHKVSFEEQLEVFKELGFELNDGASETDLINMYGKEEFENNPYSLLYICLGAQIEREPWTPITNNCWLFDTEAIAGEGDYVYILENLIRLSKGELNLKNMSDVVDVENEYASVSFELYGDAYAWELVFYDDWVDSDLFTMIVNLTEEFQTKGRFTSYDLGGQNMLIGWASPEQLEEMKAKTGLGIVWLK